MNRNIHHSQIIFLCSFLLVLVGCHNNAHLRTQKVLKPGEKAYSASGVLAMGGEDEGYRELNNTGIMGLRGEVSMLTGGEDSESGPYLGLGAGEDGPGLILGYDYRKYTGQSSGQAKKLGAQIEVNFSGAGQTFHLRPSLTSTTKRGRPFYGGVHGLLAVGRLMDRLEWETIDTSYYWNYEYHEQEFDYNFNSLGAGLTAGMELLAFNDNSLQLQVDVSLVKNSFNTDAEPPVIDMENVEWFSWEEEYYEYGGDFSHSDDPVLMVTGSAGISFFKPDPKMIAPLEPFPVPSYRPLAPPPEKIIYDPETGLPVPSEPEEPKVEFDPETGEMIQKDTETSYDPETGGLIKTNREIIHDPETGLQVPAKPTLKTSDGTILFSKKELTYDDIKYQAREAAKRMHNKSTHQLCGVGSCVFYLIGLPAAVLYVESGLLSTLDPYDPFYVELDPSQRIQYKHAYKQEEKQLRRKSIYGAEGFCVGFFFIIIMMIGGV